MCDNFSKNQPRLLDIPARLKAYFVEKLTADMAAYCLKRIICHVID